MSEVKAAEARQSVELGVRKSTWSVNLKLVKEGKFDEVEADIRAVREATEGALLKVIIVRTADR